MGRSELGLKSLNKMNNEEEDGSNKIKKKIKKLKIHQFMCYQMILPLV